MKRGGARWQEHRARIPPRSAADTARRLRVVTLARVQAWRTGSAVVRHHHDDPPPEIAEAGHDRCPVAIKQENIDAWLNPEPRNLDASDAILEDKLRPYYVHRLAP